MSGAIYHIEPQSVLSFDGRDWLLRSKGTQDYHLELLTREGQGSGSLQNFSFDRIDTAIKNGQLTIRSPHGQERLAALRAYTGGYENLCQLSKVQQRIVRGRLLMVQALMTLEKQGAKLTHRYLDQKEVRQELLDIIAEQAPKKERIYEKRGASYNDAEKLPLGRTLCKYLQLYRKFGENPIVLLHREHLKGPPPEKRAKLTVSQNNFIHDFVRKWMQAYKPGAAILRGLLTANYRAAGQALMETNAALLADFVPPSITTLRKHLKKAGELVKIASREGRRKAANLIGASTSSVRALRYGELVEIDEVYLSIFITVSGELAIRRLPSADVNKLGSPNEVLRVWLTLALDVASRMPLGWVLTRSPKADTTIRLLNLVNQDKIRMARRYGCAQNPALPTNPLRYSQDNGTALRNGSVRAGQLGAGSIVNDTRTYHSIDKPFVERFFGTMEGDLINHLAGYCGRFPGHLPGYDPKANARLSEDDLYGIITRYLIDEYPFKPHRGLGMDGMSPRQKMVEIIESYGAMPPLPRSERRLRYGIETEVLLTKVGVKSHGISFNSQPLQNYRNYHPNEKVRVILDPDDLREATVLAAGQSEPLIAHLSNTLLQDCSLDDVHSDALHAESKRILTGKRGKEALDLARARRAREMGIVSCKAPAGFTPYEDIAADLQHLLDVETRPARSDLASSHDVSNRSYKPGGKSRPSDEAASANTTKTTFNPIKDSNL